MGIIESGLQLGHVIPDVDNEFEAIAAVYKILESLGRVKLGTDILNRPYVTSGNSGLLFGDRNTYMSSNTYIVNGLWCDNPELDAVCPDCGCSYHLGNLGFVARKGHNQKEEITSDYLLTRGGKIIMVLMCGECGTELEITNA